jgi:hypothetical protein
MGSLPTLAAVGSRLDASAEADEVTLGTDEGEGEGDGLRSSDRLSERSEEFGRTLGFEIDRTCVMAMAMPCGLTGRNGRACELAATARAAGTSVFSFPFPGLDEGPARFRLASAIGACV